MSEPTQTHYHTEVIRGIMRFITEHAQGAKGFSPDLAESRVSNRLDLITSEIAALRRDAERYRKLRVMHWNESPLCVVADPKRAVRPGYDCPSGERLDALLDAAK